MGQLITTVGARKGDWIQTFSGQQFWPFDPRPEDIEIDDVAHALSMLCRYGGHCHRFYSVAEHSVLLSRHVAPKNALWALLHDASEAYLVDVPRPIKASLGGYLETEALIFAAVCERFGLGFEMPSEVKAADTAILMDERVQNMTTAPVRWSTDGRPLGVYLEYWTPPQAEIAFLDRFNALAKEPS